jgi:DNA-directed RNA polymerase sigma subunit (sigma70/sigma32)
MATKQIKVRSDVDRGGLSRAEVAAILGITEKRVMEIEEAAIKKLKLAKKLYDYAKDVCDTETWNGNGRLGGTPC